MNPVGGARARTAAPWAALALAAGALLPASFAVTGCGYSVGLDTFGSAGVRTVAVDIADNRTFRQGLEVPLTREVFSMLARHSDLTPAPRGQADAILQIVLVEARGEVLVRDAHPVREGSIDFLAKITLTERSTGQVLRQAEVLDRGEFRVTVAETTQSATDEALSDLARKIVLTLEGEF